MTRVRTGRIDGNQERIDELEFFLEGIAGFLLGGEGEDFRQLRMFVPQSRNLSGLIDLYESNPERDPSEDLRFLYGELEGSSRRPAHHDTPIVNLNATVFRYGRYLDLLDRPEMLIEVVPPAHRLEVASLVTSGASLFAPRLAALNAYAWLGAIGVPDLEAELTDASRASMEMVDVAPRWQEGMERILQASSPPPGAGIRTYFDAVLLDLSEVYRGQLARLAARTPPPT